MACQTIIVHAEPFSTECPPESIIPLDIRGDMKGLMARIEVKVGELMAHRRMRMTDPAEEKG